MREYLRKPGLRILSKVPLLVLALLLVVSVVGSLSAVPPYRRAVTTLQFNNARTGWNSNEVILTLDNVNPATFGKKWSVPLDGEISAAPLYVADVVIDGRRRNAVFVATAKNFIYALDAEDGDPLWSMPYFLGPPGSGTLLLEPPCQSDWVIGITSTPVIDLETGTLYAVGLVNEEGNFQFYKMTAIDITTGRSRPGWPIPVQPRTSPGLDASINFNRGALLLANNMVYVPFGSYGDCGPYHGWVVGVNKTFPNFPQVFFRTPGSDTHRGSGIWASGGVAADEKGNLYAATGNSFDAPALDYSNSVLRLGSDLSFSRDPADFFTPSNWEYLNFTDDDLGSSAPMLLPLQKGSKTPNMIFVAGKAGIGHLINRDNLGGLAQGDGFAGEGVYSAKVFEKVFSTATYYEDVAVGPIIFVGGVGSQPDCGTFGGVAALALEQDEAGNSSYRTLWCTRSLGNARSPVVTSAPGETGILWVVDGDAGVLYAFNAATGAELYRSTMDPDDDLGGTTRLMHFTAVDGKVFIPNSWRNELVAYGLR